MARTLIWAAGSAVVLASVVAASGCIVNVKDTGATATGDPGSGGSSSTTTGTYGGGGHAGSTATGVLPSNCIADAKDDACTACQKASCCTELKGCSGDMACAGEYNAYVDCLFPNGTDWSGYSSGYCKSDNASGAKAGASSTALIDCNVGKCDAQCSGLPQNTYANFAEKFIEAKCNGCHFPGYGEAGHLGNINTDDFTNDATWDDPMWGGGMGPGVPEGNPDWPNQGNYDMVKAKSDLIWCGVSTVLPAKCDPVKFKDAKRFPPEGTMSVDHNGDPVKCWWVSDFACPMPDDLERNQMASWIFDGMPK